MKYSREVKVGALALVCAGILYFGFNFLKGVNIFSPTDYYYGYFERSNGLTEQAPVYILGHKVGLVENIQYDFARTPAFIIGVNIDKGIQLPHGTEMALIAGLPQAPSVYSPYNNIDLARKRRNQVLGRMLKMNLDSKYGDVIERIIYNGFLSSTSLICDFSVDASIFLPVLLAIITVFSDDFFSFRK